MTMIWIIIIKITIIMITIIIKKTNNVAVTVDD